MRIEGIDGDLRRNVEQLLSIEQQRDHPLLTVGRIKRLHQKADEEIRTALKPYGYYRATVKKTLLQAGDERWSANYEISPGEPIRIDRVTLELRGEGKNDPELRRLFADFPLKPGSPLNQPEYEAAKATAIQAATESGYFEYRFVEHRIDIDLDQYQAAITLIFDSGPRYRFGPITLQQNVLDDAFLRRFIPFKEGDPYDVTQLIELQRVLSNSDYFQDIEIEPQTGTNPAHTVPVAIKLMPRKTHRFTFGIGYGTDTEVRGKIGWDVPRVTRSGHHFSSEIKASHVSKSISANYHIPIGNPTSEQITVSAAVAESTINDNYSLIRNIGVSLSQMPYNWSQTLSLNYQHERYTISDTRDRSTLLIPGVSWNRAWADNFSHVGRGLRVELDLRGANDRVLSDTTFFQASGGGKFITSLTDADRLILRGKAGRIWTDHFGQLPTSTRFFAGGSQSVRGYGYQSLGPKNDRGDVVGGRYLMVGSAEFEHSLSANWAAAIFYDVGNAIDNMQDSLEHGTGFGARWKTPIGPISFDLAWAISRPGTPWRFHINIGPDL